SDPSSGYTSWTVDINWGDSSGDTIYTASATGAITKPHTYSGDGPFTVTVTVTGIGGGSALNDVGQATTSAEAISISALSFIQQPTSTTAGSAISPAVTVQAFDQFGKPISGASITLSITGATLNGTTTQTTVSGIASYSNLSINLVGTYTLTA